MKPSDLLVVNPSLVQHIKNLQSISSSTNDRESIKVKLFKFITPRNAMICFRYGLSRVVLAPALLGLLPHGIYTKLYLEDHPNYKGTQSSKYLCPIIMMCTVPLSLLFAVFILLLGVACVVVSIPMLLVSLLLLPFRKCCLPTVNQHHSEGNLHYEQTSTSDKNYDDSSPISSESGSTVATECSLVSEKTNMLHM